jgi:class 3 adenylate cyclase
MKSIKASDAIKPDRKTSLKRRVFIFSGLFFAIILTGGCAAFFTSMRQIVRASTAGELSRIIETGKLKFEGALSGEISLAVKMADSPLIRRYFQNPGAPAIERLALEELAGYRASFTGKNIFWINDADRRYFFNDEYVYTLNPSDPQSAWYLPALNQRERFTFNVNYDIGLKKIFCWINAPVYDGSNNPVGITGTGIDLAAFSNMLFTGFDEKTELYFFNEAGEITGARDASLPERKADIAERLGRRGEDGEKIIAQTKGLEPSQVKVFFTDDSGYAVGRLPHLNWYMVATTPLTADMFFNNTMALVFFVMIFIIFLIFIIFNVFIMVIIKPLNIMLDHLRELSADWRQSKHRFNFQQLLFVFFAFSIMVAVSYLAANFILRRHLEFEAEELLRTAEATIASNLRESETTMVNSVFAVEQLIAHKVSRNELSEYLVNLTGRLLDNKDTVLEFNGLYGYLRGEYLDGLRWEPPEEYVPQERPWYIAAEEHHGTIAATQPYKDMETGGVVVSYSQELFDREGESLGVLAVDVSLNHLAEYVESLRLSDSGYGVLLNENFEVITHNNKSITGLPYESVNSDTVKIIQMLREGKEVAALKIENLEGMPATAFFKPIFNGWYVGVVTPVKAYYSDIYVMAMILTLIGTALMVSLMILLTRLHQRIASNTEVVMELNRSSIRFVPVQFMKFLGVNNITQMKLGNCVKSTMTVMFFDIRFFSIHSEMMSLTENFDLINKVFGVAGPVIRKHSGIIDKYLGDAAMVIFDNAGDAVLAGIEIYQKLILDAETRVTIGTDSIDIGIGLHSGSIMLGIIGDGERLSNTVISKHVNMASRLEGITKQVKAGMLVSSEVLQGIPESEPPFETRYLGLIQPAGTNEIIGVFEMLDALPEQIRERRTLTRELFESGIRKYHTKDYETARTRFEEITRSDPTDICAKRYLEETQKHISDPTLPSVFVFDTK